MGCDIHGWQEVKVNGNWVGIGPLSSESTRRNYERFARLAGVRGDGPEAKGVPSDMSESTRYHYERWGRDAHSATHMTAEEFATICVDTHWPEDERNREYLKYRYIDFDEVEKGTDHRVVIWFDN